jgi:hypothetical protein
VSHLDPNLVTGITAVSGTVLGGLSSFATTYFTQGRQGHAERILRDLERREDVYARFNELCSELALDALENSLDHARALVGLSALVGRIRLTSSREVLQAAERVVDYIIETYQRPPTDAIEIIVKSPREFTAPLIAFTQACRGERERMLRRL